MRNLALALLLLYFHLLAGCASPGGQPFDPRQFALTVARTIGDVALQAKGVAELQKAGAGLLVSAIDKQEPFGVLTLAEVEFFVANSTPEEVAALIAAWWLFRDAK